MSKKALIEGLTKSVSMSPGGGPTSLGPSVPSPVRDSPLLVQQLQDMRAAVTNLQSRNARMEVKELSSRLAALPKINLHSKTSGIKASQSEKQDKSKDVDNVSDLGQLMSRCNKARQELYTLISSQPIVDITRSAGGASNSGPSIKELNLRKMKEAELRKEVELLQTEMLKLMTSRKPGYKAETAFGTFASRDFAKLLNNKDVRLFGRLDLSGGMKLQEDGIPIITDRMGAIEIHKKVLC